MIRSISYSHVAQFIGANRALVSIAAAMVINQMAIRLLKSRTLENISKIPRSVMDLKDQDSIQQGIDASKTRNKKVISLIGKQNQYTALSIIISVASAVFCFHKNFKHMKYAILLQAVWNIAKLINNGKLIVSLKKHCLPINAVKLTAAVLQSQDQFKLNFQIVFQGTGIKLIKETITKKETVIPSEAPEDDDAFQLAEVSTNATRIREMPPKPNVAISFEMKEDVIGTYYLR